MTSAAPGSAQGLYLIVSDVAAARGELAGRGADVSEVFHAGTPGAQFQPDGTSGRVSGPAPDDASYSSFATFSDLDGNGFLTLLSDGQRLTGAYALGPEAGEWIQQATLAIRAHVPIEVLSDTIQPFPSFSGIYDAALEALRMQIADMPPPARPMTAQTASLSR